VLAPELCRRSLHAWKETNGYHHSYFLLHCGEDFSTVCESLAVGKEIVMGRKDDGDNLVVYGNICTKHCNILLL